MSSRLPNWRFGALICLFSAQPALAVDCTIPVVLGEKPSMDDYADYSDFLVAIMDYKARDRELQAQQDVCPEIFISAVDPDNLDPTVTYGPETIDSAVARAGKLPAIDYSTTRTWYNRSTSRSFALPGLSSSQMDSGLVSTSLRTLVDDSLSQRDQSLVLSLLGPVDDENSGNAQLLMERQRRDTLAEREAELDLALRTHSDQVTDVYTINSTRSTSYVTVYLSFGEIVFIRARGEGCLNVDLQCR